MRRAGSEYNSCSLIGLARSLPSTCTAGRSWFVPPTKKIISTVVYLEDKVYQDFEFMSGRTMNSLGILACCGRKCRGRVRIATTGELLHCTRCCRVGTLLSIAHYSSQPPLESVAWALKNFHGYLHNRPMEGKFQFARGVPKAG